jgi:hypothetical protein
VENISHGDLGFAAFRGDQLSGDSAEAKQNMYDYLGLEWIPDPA